MSLERKQKHPVLASAVTVWKKAQVWSPGPSTRCTVTSLLITNFSVNSKFVLMLRLLHQEKMTVSVILREKKARRMDVYGGLKLKTSQIKEGKHERFLSHSLFLSVRVATEHEADSWLDPPRQPHVCCVCPPHWSQVWELSVINWQPVQGGCCFWPRGPSNRNNIPVTINWMSNIYPCMIYDMPTYLSKRVVVHSKQISLERNRSENSKTLYIKNK